MTVANKKRIAVAVHALTVLIAVVGLVLAVTGLQSQISSQTVSRQRSAEDSCFLLRGIIISITPRRELQRAVSFINASKLRDCADYGYSVVHRP